MKGIVTDQVYCSSCGACMMRAEESKPSVRTWIIYCGVDYCPNFGNRFKQPIREVELAQVVIPNLVAFPAHAGMLRKPDA